MPLPDGVTLQGKRKTWWVEKMKLLFFEQLVCTGRGRLWGSHGGILGFILCGYCTRSIEQGLHYFLGATTGRPVDRMPDKWAGSER